MDHWLRFCSDDDAVTVHEALGETKKPYYNNGVDILKGELCIGLIAINLVLTKSLKTNDNRYKFFTLSCEY